MIPMQLGTGGVEGWGVISVLIIPYFQDTVRKVEKQNKTNK